MLRKIETNVTAEAGEKIFVEQTGADEDWVKRGKLAEEIVVHTKTDQFAGLEVERSVALRDARGIAAAINEGRSAGGINLSGIAKRNVAFPVEIVFEESELTGDTPGDAVDCEAAGAKEMKMIEIAIFHAGERAGDLLVGVVTPRSRIGS